MKGLCLGFLQHEDGGTCFGCPMCNPEQYGSPEDPLVYYAEDEEGLYPTSEEKDEEDDDFDPMDEIDWEYIETGRWS